MTLHCRTMDSRRKIVVRDLNPYITCALCEGYLVDATTLVDCHHVFCRSCILKYFENCKTGCPTCNTLYKKKTQTCFKSDPQIQSLVYKMVPGLYFREMQRREDFYRSTAVRASSSCSDDSVLERERDGLHDQEERVSCCVGDKTQFYGPEDHISLSLEYYQVHLDTSSTTRDKTKRNSTEEIAQPRTTLCSDRESEDATCGNSASEISDNTAASGVDGSGVCAKSGEPTEAHKNNGSVCDKDSDDGKVKTDDNSKQCSADKRFLQCPAAVSMKHLQKFIRMKYALTPDHRVDIIYQGEVLPVYFSLMDVAYTFKWNRAKPMRFFYRIFTPLKVRPIKIINTSSTGGKQLQIVPAKPLTDPHRTIPQEKIPKCYDKPEEKPDETRDEERQKERKEKEKDEDRQHNEEKHKKLKEKEEKLIEKYEQLQDKKERLLAHLQLQSKSKVQIKEATPTRVPEPVVAKSALDCIYTYEEPDKEEIKRFAEKRDREWALQKQLDDEYGSHHFTKKRKKNKHSKSESMHKKRKLHAEITSNEKEDLKLKVKLTPHNGHKHKHHRSSQSGERSDSKELSSKEKLLQMRQVRHKHVSSEDKNVQTVPTVSLTNISLNVSETKERIEENVVQTPSSESRDKCVEAKMDSEPPNQPVTLITAEPPQVLVKETKPATVNEPTTSTSSSCQTVAPTEVPTSEAKTVASQSKTLRSDFSTKQVASREWGSKVPTVQLERNEMTERQAQKTFLKTFQTYTEKYQRQNEKIQQNKVEGHKMTIKTQANSLLSRHNLLEKKIASLQQHCTIETKPQPTKPQDKPEKKVPSNADSNKSSLLNGPYHPGFTVSKIESGVKRKTEEEDNTKDKRPSLEITLINPPIPSPTTSTSTQKSTDIKTTVKRPPPATIPLERIKKSNLKSGISIIPKMPEKCDNIGALDLSKPNKSPEGSPQRPATEIKPINGFNIAAALANRQLNNATPRPSPSDSSRQAAAANERNILSNLQMLSKVATEHPTLNKPSQSVNPSGKPRPQMPNLQTLKYPHGMQGIGVNRPPNLAKMPKLNEINKSQFRFANPQIRNLRPNQNQSIRNIPNPSLLVRQQNQNRLNSMNSLQNASTSNGNQQKMAQSSSPAAVPKESVDKPSITVSADSRLTEKKEISVGQ